MCEAVYVRFDKQNLDFISEISNEEKISRSEAIKRLVEYASKELTIKRAIQKYKDGKCTIRECAESTGMRYFEFFDAMAKENLIGTSPENTDLLLERAKRLGI